MARVLYASHPGGRPLRIGMNHAKRLARAWDKRDQQAVLREMGPGYPRQHSHHQQLVKQRHAAIGERYDAYVAAKTGRDQGRGNQAAGDTVGAVPDAAPGTDPGQRAE